MLFLLKNGREPGDAGEFSQRIRQFLSDFERGAKKLNASADDMYAASFRSAQPSTNRCCRRSSGSARNGSAVRCSWCCSVSSWRARSSITTSRNAALRAQRGLQSLEVFHMCLLLGFQGKYMFEGPEKLSYLTARLGDEIAHMKGKRAPFAPHWPLPDQVAHRLKREVALWTIGAVFALVAVLGYLGLNTWLRDTTLRSSRRIRR
jgi:type VI secretion system protein ImpK